MRKYIKLVKMSYKIKWRITHNSELFVLYKRDKKIGVLGVE